MVNLIVAAALAAASATIAPTESPAELAPDGPATFRVGDADTTVYIFGTFHALAFEQSGELVLETVIPESPNQPIATTGGFRWSVAPSTSSLATTPMAIKAGRAQGMQVDNGADMVLRRAAEAEGKSVQGLETLQFQIDMFNHMPGAMAAPAPSARSGSPAASPMQSLSKAMVDMQAAWKNGDQRVFVNMLSQLKAASPDTCRIMFTDRNDRWADWVRARMQTPGAVFVAVGAGHLAGQAACWLGLQNAASLRAGPTRGRVSYQPCEDAVPELAIENVLSPASLPRAPVRKPVQVCAGVLPAAVRLHR